MDAVLFKAFPGRVRFGLNSVDQLPGEVTHMGATRALIRHSQYVRAVATELIGGIENRLAGVCEGAAAHVPIEAAEAVRAIARDLCADCYVAIGGGSTIGLATALALDIALPIIAVPTTYAGSEMTPIWSLAEPVRRARDATRPCGRAQSASKNSRLSAPAFRHGGECRVARPGHQDHEGANDCRAGFSPIRQTSWIWNSSATACTTRTSTN